MLVNYLPKYFCEVVEKIVNLNISLNISVQNLPAINFLPEFSPGVLSVIWLLAYPGGGVLRKNFDGGERLRFSIGYPWLRSISRSWAHFYVILRNFSPKIPFLCLRLNAFRRRRHYVFGLSGRPVWRRQERRSKYAVQLASWQLRSNSPKTSVRPKPEIPSFDLYVGPPDQP